MSDYNDGLLPEPCLRLDFGFGQEYASVELGDGTGYVRVADELRGEHHKMQRWYDDELKAALDENAKLREERNHWHVEQVHAYGNWEDTYKRAVELESENAKLREQIEHLQPTDCEGKLQAENVKLRELAHRACGYIQFMQDTWKRDFELEEVIIDMSRELGVQTDREEDDG